MTILNWQDLENIFIEYRDGDSKRVRILFENLHLILKKFCHFKGKSTDAEDLSQQILLKIHIARNDYDPSKCFKSWIFTIAQNLIIDNWRVDKESKFTHIEEDLIDLEIENVSIEIENINDKDEIEHLFRDLTPLELSLVKLFFVEEFTIKEMTTILSMKESAIKVRIHRILGKVRIKNEHN